MSIIIEEIASYINIGIETPPPVIIEIAEMGLTGPPGPAGATGGVLSKVSGESIPSYTPIAIYNNLAYKLDASNPLHQFAFVGFSTNGTSIGQTCEIKQIGEVYLSGWGLIPNQQYLSGINGTLITENLSSSNFTKVIGYATDSNTLQIIKDLTTINK